MILVLTQWFWTRHHSCRGHWDEFQSIFVIIGELLSFQTRGSQGGQLPCSVRDSCTGKELFCKDIQKCTLEIHWPAPCEGHAPPCTWEHFELRRHVLNKEKTVSCSTTSLLTFPFLKVHLGIWHILRITLYSLSGEIWMQSSFLLKTAWIIFCQFHLLSLFLFTLAVRSLFPEE